MRDAGNVSIRTPCPCSVIPTGLGDSTGDRLGQSGPWVTFHRTHGAFDVSVSSLADSWCFCKSCPIPHDTGGPPKPEKCPARVRFWQECGPFERPPCSPSGSPVNSCCHSVCGRIISSLCKLIPTSQFHLKKFSCAELHRVNKLIHLTLICLQGGVVMT